MLPEKAPSEESLCVVVSFIMMLFSFSGSMPPDSHTIFEEGAVFKSFKIVNQGVFQEEGK